MALPSRSAPPTCICGPPTPRAPWHVAHCAAKITAPSNGLAAERLFVEPDAGDPLPAADVEHDGIDVGARERPAAVLRPGGHRAAAPTVGDRPAEVLVAHRREKVRLGQARRLIGGVALPGRPMADGAHAPIQPSAAGRLQGERRRWRRMRFGVTRERERQSKHRDRHARYGGRAQHRAGEAQRKSVPHGEGQALSHRLDRREPGKSSVTSVVRSSAQVALQPDRDRDRYRYRYRNCAAT